MAIDTYREWRRDGSPWDPAEYISSFAETLREHGYTVGTIGDIERHLDIEYPQDHAPFSHTAWPDPQPYPLVCALDIMPNGPVPLWKVGKQIVADKKARVPGTGWIKYINWTDQHGDCWNESWKPNHRRSPSGDRGHIHISGRTDKVHQKTEYDPIAVLLGEPSGPGKKPKPPRPPRFAEPGSRQLWVTDPLMTGEDVDFVQRYIGEKRCGRADGVYGNHTAQGVRWYQDMRGIKVDGVVGIKTWKQLGVL